MSRRSLADVKLAASTSFTPAELDALDELLGVVRRGGDARVIVRAPSFGDIARKVLAMRHTVERQRVRRAEIVASRGASS